MNLLGKQTAPNAATAVIVIFVSASACANATDRSSRSSSNSGSERSSGSGAAGSVGATGASGTGIIIGGGGPGGTGGVVPGEECFSTVSTAEQVVVETTVEIVTYLPFDMYVMFDQSGSMDDETPTGTKWTDVEAALTGFLNDPSSEGIGVGIGYFPFVDPDAPVACCESADCLLPLPCGSFGPCVELIPGLVGYCEGADSCIPDQYATPDVPIEPITPVVPKITASLAMHGPGGGTPTGPALQGALNYAIPQAAANPDRKTIVVLATDGDPSGCVGNSVQDVANIAASGVSSTPSVETFVIGVGRSLTSLNAIAAAGGTGQAFIVDAANGDPTQQFLDALNMIRDSVTMTEIREEIQTMPVPCEWVIPESPTGETFDKNKVNFDYTSGGNSAERVGYVESEADCANVDGGWYYDDANNPQIMLVCPQTCNVIQATDDTRVDISFGCETEIAVVK